MPGSNLHREQDAQDGVHQIHNWDVADAAARLALGVSLRVTDIGKVAMQTDTSPPTFWVLANLPSSWIQIGNGGSTVLPAVNPTGAGSLATIEVGGVPVPLRAPNYLEVDLTLPPYNILAFEDINASLAYLNSGNCRNAENIERFLADSFATNYYITNQPAIGQLMGVLPHGVIPMERRIVTLGHAAMDGALKESTCFHYREKGPMIIAGYNLSNASFTGGFPQEMATGPVGVFGTGGGVVSTTLPLRGADGFDRNYNITETAGLHWLTGASQLDLRIGFISSDITDAGGYIYTHKGRVLDGDRGSSMMLVNVVTSNVVVELRTLDPMNLKEVDQFGYPAAGSPVVTLSTTGGGIPDGVPLTVKILSGTTFSYSDNDQLCWIANYNVATTDPAYGTDVHYIPGAGVPYALSNRVKGAPQASAALNFLNFPAGAYVAGKRYSTLQLISHAATTQLTAPGTAKAYEIALSYNGATSQIALNTVGWNGYTAAADPVPTAAKAQTGKVYSFDYEESCVGVDYNTLFPSGPPSRSAAAGSILYFAINNVATAAVAVPDPVTKTIISVTGRHAWYPVKPASAYAIKSGGGQMFAIKTQLPDTVGCIQPFLEDDLDFTKYLSITNVSFRFDAHATAIYLARPSQCVIRYLGHSGSGQLLRAYSGFFNEFGDFTSFGTGRYNIALQGDPSLLGKCTIKGGGIPLALSGEGILVENCAIDLEGFPACAAILRGYKLMTVNIYTSDESAGSIQGGTCALGAHLMVSMGLNSARADIRGGTSIFTTQSHAMVVSGLGFGKINYGALMQISPTLGRLFAITDAGIAAITTPQQGVEITAEFRVQNGGYLSWANRPEFFLRTREQPLDDAIAIVAATTTISRVAGSWFRMVAGTTTGVQPITIAHGVGVRKGMRIRVSVFIQANNMSFINGGGGAGTLDTVVAGQKLFREYISTGTDWEIYA